MSGSISNFYPGTTKQFTLVISVSGVAQDISAGTVIWRMKNTKYDSDTDAVLSNTADVATGGAGGTAIFTLSAANNTLTPGQYYTDVTWLKAAGAGEYVVYDSVVQVLERVSD